MSETLIHYTSYESEAICYNTWGQILASEDEIWKAVVIDEVEIGRSAAKPCHFKGGFINTFIYHQFSK